MFWSVDSGLASEPDHQIEGAISGEMAILNHIMGHLDEVMQNCENALKIAREIDNRRGEGNALAHKAELDRKQGNYEDALQGYCEALDILREVKDSRLLACHLCGYADLLLDSRQFENSDGVLAEVSDKLKEHDMPGMQLYFTSRMVGIFC